MPNGMLSFKRDVSKFSHDTEYAERSLNPYTQRNRVSSVKAPRPRSRFKVPFELRFQALRKEPEIPGWRGGLMAIDRVEFSLMYDLMVYGRKRKTFPSLSNKVESFHSAPQY